MLIVRSTPSQFEIPINDVSTYLHGKILSELGLTTNEIKGYGCTYLGKSKNGKRPYFYESGTNKDYKEVLFDDKLALMYFFGVSDNIEYKGAFGFVDAHLIIFSNLNKVFVGETNRNDVQLRKTILDLIYVHRRGFSLQSEMIGFDASLKEYDGLKDKDMAKFDMHPFHVFRFNFNLRFPIHNKI